MPIKYPEFAKYGKDGATKRWDEYRAERQRWLDKLEPITDVMIFKLVRAKIKDNEELARLYKSIMKTWRK